MKTWAGRPTELAYNFNPAFCGWLLREAVEGYASVRAVGMPLPLTFLILPVVLHRPTRELVPGAVSTKLHVWLQEHSEVRINFAERTKELAPFTREALLFLGAEGSLWFRMTGLSRWSASSVGGRPGCSTTAKR